MGGNRNVLPPTTHSTETAMLVHFSHGLMEDERWFLCAPGNQTVISCFISRTARSKPTRID
jgi:hypothetical protein